MTTLTVTTVSEGTKAEHWTILSFAFSEADKNYINFNAVRSVMRNEINCSKTLLHDFITVGHSETCIIQHTRFTALCPGLPIKVKPIWILLKQETVSGSGISWAICKSAPCSRQITIPHHSFFTDRMPFLSPNQQRQSTEGIIQRHRKRQRIY